MALAVRSTWHPLSNHVGPQQDRGHLSTARDPKTPEISRRRAGCLNLKPSKIGRTKSGRPNPQDGWVGRSRFAPELLVDLVAEALQPLLEPRMTVERPFHPSMHGIAGYRHQRHAQEKK